MPIYVICYVLVGFMGILGLWVDEGYNTCLLPKQMYGGWEGSVLWYDLDGHFEMLCLVCLL
jgi:hypothetical protein